MPDPEKRKLADAAVARLQQLVDPEAIDILVHWDDCDSDEAKFWFHFRVKSMRSYTPRSKQATVIALRIREAWKKVDKELAGPSPYQFVIDRQSAPVARYISNTSPRVFKEYEGDTWIYTLTIFG